MSLSKKLFLSGYILATVLVVIVPASAQTWDGRPWKPYQPQQFGGNRRSADGFYFGIEALNWRIENPRHVDNTLKEMKSAGVGEDLDTENLPSKFDLGTRITFGNRSGHHGWRFSGYGISKLGGSVSHADPVDFSRQGTNTSILMYPDADDSRFGYYRFNDDWVDIRAERVLSFGSRTKVTDLDLAWSYRPHPFRWGELELFAGVKYRDVTDRLLFSDKANSYLYQSFTWDVGRKYAYDPRLYRTSVPSGPLLDATSATRGIYESDDESLIPSITESVQHVNRNVRNRMIGPSLGFELSRRNARWTFGFAPSLFLGVNNQSFNFEQYYVDRAILAQDLNNNNSGNSSSNRSNNEADWGSLSVDQLAAIRNVFRTGNSEPVLAEESARETVYYSKHRTVFSPGVSLQLSAKWQWTDAVGVKFAFDGTLMDNVARGTDLVVTPKYAETVDGTLRDGYDFKLRTKGEPVLLYGISIGLEMKR